MTVGLFVPCYVDQLYPQVAIATLRLLERLGCDVVYPADQTCCGQPLANAGYAHAAHDTMRHFVRCFDGFDHVVAPSASCVAHVRHHFDRLEQTDAVRRVRARTWELCQFLTDGLGVGDTGAIFRHRVGLHPGCHGLRMLDLARPSEVQAPPFDRVRGLLERVAGIELVEPDRPDECCGFGGTFAVFEEAVSVRMGQDRVQDYVAHGAEFITSVDMSCLMHLDGLIRRQGLDVRVIHVAEILDAGAAAGIADPSVAAGTAGSGGASGIVDAGEAAGGVA
jgi:L-lactate dehydrogenase complex protein LldE